MGQLTHNQKRNKITLRDYIKSPIKHCIKYEIHIVGFEFSPHMACITEFSLFSQILIFFFGTLCVSILALVVFYRFFRMVGFFPSFMVESSKNNKEYTEALA